MGIAHVVLTFVWFTNESKDNTDKTVTQKSVQRLYKRNESWQLMKKIINMLLEIYTPWKAAANLTVYSLCIDTYITTTEKESKLS